VAEAEAEAQVGEDQEATAEDEAGAEPPSEPPPPIVPLPLDSPLPEGDHTWLTDFRIYKQEILKLARGGKWRDLAAVTGHALLHAPYADQLTRTGMLLDLARIYRDRLKDVQRAEETFLLVTREEPANSEAMTFLIEHYTAQADWGSIYDLHMAAVEANWDPVERLNWTRKAANLAMENMEDASLAIRAWEHLWHLGDAIEESSRELTKLYRVAGRWAEMSTFLKQQCEHLEGAAKLVVLRELAEVELSGLKNPDGASKILEEIVELRPQDPIATLQLARVYTQRQDWDGLQRLGRQSSSEDVPVEAALDLQHQVADALWLAEMLDEAVEFYDLILAVDPADALAAARKQEYLTRTDRNDELLSLLVANADSTGDDEKCADLLAQAAILAEDKLQSPDQAAQLWERRITIDAEHQPSFQALTRLYEALGDLGGIARSLEGQLALSKDVKARIEIFRQLGEHYAVRMGDDDKAEDCWKEILALDPNDFQVREELIELHRRRGNFESLNSALKRQIWLTSDEDRARKLCRLAAENLDQNFDDPKRSVEAWHRVLDFAPLDTTALMALSNLYTILGRPRDLIRILEQEIRAQEEIPKKIARALQIAQLWHDEEKTRAEAATLERILRWDQSHHEALDRLVSLYSENDQQGLAIGVLEHASLLTEDAVERAQVLRRVLDLLPEDDHTARFYLLRRILLLCGGERSVVEELKKEAEAAKLWPEFTAVLTLLASQEPGQDKRIALLEESAGILEQKLEAPDRAYLTLQQALLIPEDNDQVLEEITRLACATERYEDLLAVLDRFTSPEFELERRKEVIQQRAEICLKNLDDGPRAFLEYQRLLELNPGDQEPLAELERLAGEHGLWGQFDIILAELEDRSADLEERLDLLTRRETLRRDKLGAREEALDLLVLRYRLAPDDPEITRALSQDVADLDAWEWILPLMEGAALNTSDAGVVEEIVETARLYEEKLSDEDRAFHLLAASLLVNPDTSDNYAKLEELAIKGDLFDSLANIFRLAAATSDDLEHTVELLRRIATIYEEKLDQPDQAIDIYSRVLALKDDDIPSLQVMLDWHRDREEWRDLRDRLRQRLRLTSEEEEAEKIPLLLEVAQISEEHLTDAEEALQAFGEVLEIDQDHQHSRDGLDSLVSSMDEPGLRLRWLEMQLRTAHEDDIPSLRMDIARLQEDDLDDRGGAIATLQALVSETGPDGPGFAMLRRMLRQAEQWKDLVQLLRDNAEATEDQQAQQSSLEEALAICNEHLGDSAGDLWEDLYRAMLSANPGDRDTRGRLARYLRQAGRLDDLCLLLEENHQYLDHGLDQAESYYELGRLQALTLDMKEAAQTTWKKLLEESPEEEGAVLALANQAYADGDMEAYVAFRRQQAKILPKNEAALVLCHLAEVADETPEFKKMMVPCYREARTLDPTNVPAMEALKGIGRRLKDLRPAASLLPLEGERELSWEERAERLKALGDGAYETDLRQAVEWYRRAVAVNPNSLDCWAALAAALTEQSDLAGTYRAYLGELQALERTTQLSAEKLEQEADLLYKVALAARNAGEFEAYAHHIRRAYDQVPHHAPSALATAQMYIADDKIEPAHALLHRILLHHESKLTHEQRVEALYSRSLTLRKLGRIEEAMDDLREVLRAEPLHADALGGMGEMLAESGRTAAAIEIQIRALMTVEEPEERAELYYRLGVLWEDGLDARAEAGVCYELALAQGLEHRALLHRALQHLQRTGRMDQSLEVVNSLLPTAEDPDELATLWLVRGEIYSAREGQEEEAMEAFDMALSYDPSKQEARDGLTVVLERQGDWSQLLQVLESTFDGGSPEQQGSALFRMANICNEELGDSQRAEGYLMQSVELFPTKDALLQLEQIYSVDSGRIRDRMDVLGLLTAFGPPWFERCMELANHLLEENKPWSWCLMSPLLGVSQVAPEIKTIIQSMRKEYERPPVLCPNAEDLELLYHPDALPTLREVLAEMGELIHPLGVSSLETAGDGNAIPIGETTTMGKAFAAVAEAMNLPGCVLHRTQSLDSSVCVVNSRPHPSIIVRTDIMQQLVHAEVGFLFAYVLELARPGHREMAALDADNRDVLVPALWLALSFTDDADREVSMLAERIGKAVAEEQRDAWAERLADLQFEDPVELGRRWWSGICYTARRAGLVAGADLRQVFRIQSRLTEEVARPRVVARMEELDQYLASSPILQDLVAFSASPAFGRLLSGAVIAHK